MTWHDKTPTNQPRVKVIESALVLGRWSLRKSLHSHHLRRVASLESIAVGASVNRRVVGFEVLRDAATRLRLAVSGHESYLAAMAGLPHSAEPSNPQTDRYRLPINDQRSRSSEKWPTFAHSSRLLKYGD